MSLKKALKEEKEWDKYWTKKKTFSQQIYRIVASFYRNHIIRKNLTEVLKKEFKKDSKLLHAGSGSGQVDKGALKIFDITALDISNEALKIYKKTKLHPDEISLIENEKQVKEFLKDNGFRVKKFYFGAKDLFTYCVIVAEKYGE